MDGIRVVYWARFKFFGGFQTILAMLLVILAMYVCMYVCLLKPYWLKEITKEMHFGITYKKRIKFDD
jgi:hypothetical protein